MLQLIDLAVGYKRPVVENLNLVFQRASISAIMGLNGSGKSTLLKTLLTLLPSLHGRILFDGNPLEKIRPNERAPLISLLEAQSPVPFPMGVGELMELACRRHDSSTKAKLQQEALSAVGLEGWTRRNLMEMSSGEIRRAFIAHALCLNSTVTMIDEPFAHLDWNHQHGLARALVSWKEKYKTTFILAIHEWEWGVKIADQACALGNNRLLAHGAPADVFKSPLVQETFRFRCVIDDNPLDGSLRLTLGAQDIYRKP